MERKDGNAHKRSNDINCIDDNFEVGNLVEKVKRHEIQKEHCWINMHSWYLLELLVSAIQFY